MKRKLAETYGGSVQTEGGPLWAFPEAADLADVPAANLGALVGNARKGQYLAAVVQAFGDIQEEWLRTAPYAEVEAWLRRIHGIGTWSATFVLMRGLGRMERLPLDDPESLFIKEMLNAAIQAYGPMSFEEFKVHVRHYGDLQGHWAHYLRAAVGLSG